MDLGEYLNEHFQENLKYYLTTSIDNSMNYALYDSKSIYYDIKWDLLDEMEVYLWDWIKGAIGHTLEEIWL